MSSMLLDQLGLVSSLLAGFAFTFLGSLLGVSQRSRAHAVVYASALVAALTLLVAAVCAVFARLALEGRALDAWHQHNLHRAASQAFLLGTTSVVVSAGASGWLHTRRLGVLSTVLATLALALLTSVLAPFVSRQ